jgi:hypothetical protein
LGELVEAVPVAASVTSLPLIAQATFADDEPDLRPVLAGLRAPVEGGLLGGELAAVAA